MHPFEFREENFRPDSLLNYKLSIQLNLNGFSFCLSEVNSGIIPYFKLHPFRLSNAQGLSKKIIHIIRDEALLTQIYSGVNIFLNTKRFTIVPTAFFNQDSARKIFQLNFGPVSGIKIGWYKVDSADLVIVYEVPLVIKNVFEEYLDGVSFLPVLYPLLNYTSFISKDIERFIQVCFIDSGFFLIVYNEARPVFINYFNHTHSNDLAYYILTVLQHLRIGTDSLRIFISGEIDTIPDLKINNQREPVVEFINMASRNMDAQILGLVPFHKYFSLLFQE
jgi:hypothetical protein